MTIVFILRENKTFEGKKWPQTKRFSTISSNGN